MERLESEFKYFVILLGEMRLLYATVFQRIENTEWIKIMIHVNRYYTVGDKIHV